MRCNPTGSTAAPEPRGRAGNAVRAVVAATALMIGATSGAARNATGAPDTGNARFDPARFRSAVANPYHPLVPGTTCRYVEKLGRHLSDIEITVTDTTRVVLGVTCRVVRERVWEKGKLTQETHSCFAPDDEGNVWWFGEESREFLDRGRVSTEGSWEAGVDEAAPGIAMPARPQPGEPFRLGFAAEVSEDMAQIVAVDDSVAVPYGTFRSCVKTKEWSMLESGTDKKWYAPGIGLVRALSAAREETMLVSVTRP